MKKIAVKQNMVTTTGTNVGQIKIKKLRIHQIRIYPGANLVEVQDFIDNFDSRDDLISMTFQTIYGFSQAGQWAENYAIIVYMG